MILPHWLPKVKEAFKVAGVNAHEQWMVCLWRADVTHGTVEQAITMIVDLLFLCIDV